MGVGSDSAAENLFHAEAAVRYTRDKLKLGSANKLGDIAEDLRVLTCHLDGAGARLFGSDVSLEDHITETAERAERGGCGNCGEMTAVAFKYLERVGIRPIEMMQFTNKNHGFVVIGRIYGKVPVADWGPACMVADPWLNKGEWYRAVDLAKYWPGGMPGLTYRLGEGGPHMP